ncbi:pacearchaeosortase [Candidatus Pacearchaeota archaeon]|nr:pacearchaeosortase [Candidatus Pacearchaeota archaeon]
MKAGFRKSRTAIENEDVKSIFSIFLRYVLLIVLAYFFFFSPIFYNLFLKLTIYPVNTILGLFYDTNIQFNQILIGDKIIEIISACVAVSAYFLLLCLNLLTPAIRRRLTSIVLSFVLLLLFNILRIFLLSVLFVQEYVYFDTLHKTLWYSLNLIIVAGIWFLTAYLFKVKSIPVYSDFKFLFQLIKKSKK